MNGHNLVTKVNKTFPYTDIVWPRIFSMSLVKYSHYMLTDRLIALKIAVLGQFKKHVI